MKLFGLKDENGKEYVIEADLRSCFHNIINVMPIEPTPKFKVGKWYVCGSYIFRVINIDSAWIYFDKENSHVIGDPKMRVSSGWADSCHPATASEIESFLIKVAESRGFKDGFKYRDQSNKGVFKLCLNKLTYWVDSDMLSDGYGGAIYEKGKWATIIPDKKPLPKTKEEFMNFLGTYCNRHCKSVQEFLDEYED